MLFFAVRTQKNRSTSNCIILTTKIVFQAGHRRVATTSSASADARPRGPGGRPTTPGIRRRRGHQDCHPRCRLGTGGRRTKAGRPQEGSHRQGTQKWVVIKLDLIWVETSYYIRSFYVSNLVKNKPLWKVTKYSVK